MGNTSYNFQSKSVRTADFHTKTTNQIFEQNVKRVVHASMLPLGITVREARDSELHPHSFPIIIGLDVTGSMGHIPEDFIKDGLPKLISSLTEAGIEDPAILFIAVGDHISDSGPLQVAQFESGDAELDMWLSRVWIEGNGGGNNGESYPLVHYIAAKHTVTDHWEKRASKGFIFTIGDERFHETYSSSYMKELTGNSEASGFSAAEILAQAKEKWNVFHIQPGMEKDNSRSQWTSVLGENNVWVDSYRDIPKRIAETIIPHVKQHNPEVIKTTPNTGEDNGILL
tara:strand:+ start:6902 stop:7756 length:855 start_codon:yes stop_codon:yes gene_type:complete